jgi:hypothetical protein
VGSQSNDAESTEPVPLKYSKASDISTEDFLAAARRAAASGFARLHEIAWELSDHPKPATLSDAPDVSKFALEQKARQLALRKTILHAKDTLYQIPPAQPVDKTPPA